MGAYPMAIFLVVVLTSAIATTLVQGTEDPAQGIYLGDGLAPVYGSLEGNSWIVAWEDHVTDATVEAACAEAASGTRFSGSCSYRYGVQPPSSKAATSSAGGEATPAQWYPSASPQYAGVGAEAVDGGNGASTRAVAISMTVNNLKSLLEAYLGDVRYASADVEVTGAAPAIQTLNFDSWGLDRMDNFQGLRNYAYQYDDAFSGLNTNTNQYVNVYVLDTGVLTTHNEFRRVVGTGPTSRVTATTAMDFVTFNRTTDCHGHGTAVAAVIGGRTFGVTKNVNMHAVRVLDCRNVGTISWVIAGIRWVRNNKLLPAIINLSIQPDVYSKALDDEIQLAVLEGIVVVTAAGNRAMDACFARQSAAAINVASASDNQINYNVLSLSAFSNYGTDCVDFAAPGENITTATYLAVNSNATFSGTSMAAAHLTGVAAIYLARNPDANPAQVREALSNSAIRGLLWGNGVRLPYLFPVINSFSPRISVTPRNVIVVEGDTLVLTVRLTVTPTSMVTLTAFTSSDVPANATEIRDGQTCERLTTDPCTIEIYFPPDNLRNYIQNIDFIIFARSSDLSYNSSSTYVSIRKLDSDIVSTSGRGFEDAIPIPSLPFSYVHSTRFYNNKFNPSSQGCISSLAPDVVYKFTPTEPMDIIVSTCGNETNFDTLLSVYKGEFSYTNVCTNECILSFQNVCNDGGVVDFPSTASVDESCALGTDCQDCRGERRGVPTSELVACSSRDDTCLQNPLLSSALTVRLDAGTVYYFVVDGVTTTSLGTYRINVVVCSQVIDETTNTIGPFIASTTLIRTNWTRQVSIPQFDPACGELVSVDIVLVGDVQGNLGIESLSGATSVATARLGATIMLQQPGGDEFSQLLLVQPNTTISSQLEPYDGFVDFNGPSGDTYSGLAASQTSKITVLDDLYKSPQRGAPDRLVNFTIRAEGFNETSEGSFVQGLFSDARATLYVTYNIVPKPPVCNNEVSASTGLQTTTWQRALLLPQFNPDCGLLASVSISLAGTSVHKLDVESLNTGANGTYVNMNVGSHITLLRSFGTPVLAVTPHSNYQMQLGPFDGRIDFANISGKSMTDQVEAEAQATVTDFLYEFVSLDSDNLGNVTFIVTATKYEATLNSTGSVTRVSRSNASASLTVEYIIAIPSPPQPPAPTAPPAPPCTYTDTYTKIFADDGSSATENVRFNQFNKDCGLLTAVQLSLSGKSAHNVFVVSLFPTLLEFWYGHAITLKSSNGSVLTSMMPQANFRLTMDGRNSQNVDGVAQAISNVTITGNLTEFIQNSTDAVDPKVDFYLTGNLEFFFPAGTCLVNASDSTEEFSSNDRWFDSFDIPKYRNACGRLNAIIFSLRTQHVTDVSIESFSLPFVSMTFGTQFVVYRNEMIHLMNVTAQRTVNFTFSDYDGNLDFSGLSGRKGWANATGSLDVTISTASVVNLFNTTAASTGDAGFNTFFLETFPVRITENFQGDLGVDQFNPPCGYLSSISATLASQYFTQFTIEPVSTAANFTTLVTARAVVSLSREDGTQVMQVSLLKTFNYTYRTTGPAASLVIPVNMSATVNTTIRGDLTEFVAEDPAHITPLGLAIFKIRIDSLSPLFNDTIIDVESNTPKIGASLFTRYVTSNRSPPPPPAVKSPPPVRSPPPSPNPPPRPPPASPPPPACQFAAAASTPMFDNIWNITLGVPQFDRACGTLTSVALGLSGQAITTVQLESQDFNFASRWVFFAGSRISVLRVSGGLLATVLPQTVYDFSLDRWDGALDFVGTSGRSGTGDNTAIANTTITTNLGEFTTTFANVPGIATFWVSGVATNNLTSSASLIKNLLITSGATLTLRYLQPGVLIWPNWTLLWLYRLRPRKLDTRHRHHPIRPCVRLFEIFRLAPTRSNVQILQSFDLLVDYTGSSGALFTNVNGTLTNTTILLASAYDLSGFISSTPGALGRNVPLPAAATVIATATGTNIDVVGVADASATVAVTYFITAPTGGSLDPPTLSYSERGFTGAPAAPMLAMGPSNAITVVKSSFGRSIYRVYQKDPWQQVKQSFLTQFHRSNTICRTGPFVNSPNTAYDQTTDRWLIMETARNGTENYLCLLLSLSSIPYGLQYRGFAITLPADPGDYAFSVMPDGYYMATFENPPAVYAIDRLTRALVRFLPTTLTNYGLQGLMPATLSGLPARLNITCGFFLRAVDDEISATTPDTGGDYVEVWQLCPSFENVALGNLTRVANVRVSEFDLRFCGSVNDVNCFAQPGSTVLLNTYHRNMLVKASFRTFTTYDSLLASWTVDGGSDKGSIFWVELRRSVTGTVLGAWTKQQDGLVNPGTRHSWLSAITMDRSNNVVLGYAGVDAANNVNASYFYTGRLSYSGAGSMSGPEALLIAGNTPSINTTFGGRSAIALDAMDGCTFYMLGPWETRTSRSATFIGAVRYGTCRATAACNVDSQCNDGQFCTLDKCRDGKCINEPDLLLCPFGTVCNEVTDTCVAA
eukprot:jgi/Mesvir1/480/Mv11352-RA.1